MVVALPFKEIAMMEKLLKLNSIFSPEIDVVSLITSVSISAALISVASAVVDTASLAESFSGRCTSRISFSFSAAIFSFNCFCLKEMDMFTDPSAG